MSDTYDLDYLSDHADSFGGTAEDVDIYPQDVDEDGMTDGVVFEQSTGESILLLDTDKDAAIDLLGMDVDANSQVDIYVAREGDSYVVWADDDQDGEVDRGEQAVLSREELDALIPGAADLLDQKIADVVPEDDYDGGGLPVNDSDGDALPVDDSDGDALPVDDSDGDALPIDDSDEDITGGIE
jgi:hypothetical protein